MRSHHDILDRWLDAERNDRGDEADAALLALFSALPPLAPPAGFAGRVLLRAGLAPAEAAPQSLFTLRWVRAALVLGLLSIGASTLWLPQTLRALAGLWSLGDLFRILTGSVVRACHWLSSALGLWDLLVTIGRALAAPLETPAAALGMVSCLLVSMVAFRFLRSLIPRDRSWFHETI